MQQKNERKRECKGVKWHSDDGGKDQTVKGLGGKDKTARERGEKSGFGEGGGDKDYTTRSRGGKINNGERIFRS